MIALDKVHDLTTQRNMETLRRLVLDTGGRTADIRWGQATITWPGGSVNSNAATVAHGLASAPVFMTVQASNGGGFYDTVVGPSGTTNLSIQLRRTDGVTPAAGATLTVYWLVIG